MNFFGILKTSARRPVRNRLLRFESLSGRAMLTNAIDCDVDDTCECSDSDPYGGDACIAESYVVVDEGLVDENDPNSERTWTVRLYIATGNEADYVQISATRDATALNIYARQTITESSGVKYIELSFDLPTDDYSDVELSCSLDSAYSSSNGDKTQTISFEIEPD